MGNPFVHVDLVSDDPEAAKKFYASVFEWKFQDVPGMGWSGVDVGDGTGGGIGKKQQPGATVWTAYVGVDDVKKTIAKAKKAGATIEVPFMEVPNMGCFGVFLDPQGARIGVWQAVKAAAGAPGKPKSQGAPTTEAPPAAKPTAPAPTKAPAVKPGPNKTSMAPPPPGRSATTTPAKPAPKKK